MGCFDKSALSLWEKTKTVEPSFLYSNHLKIKQLQTVCSRL
nr:MAG TPA: hypothetical protein [Caudoviricetes sp.]